ncbi:lantibiotic dehydratase C-terminal domain-containing protein [Kitasatospora sp. NPDC098652]|uniref:lantibiotic dehydratase C-terminal domain-containing protein n=1 Tax=Kitasatospora sp. NPDC098652 TaxID=3364095 RepID=UPI00380F90A8
MAEPGPGSGREWLSLHAFSTADATALLVRTVRPLVAELRRDGLIDEYFYLRYWEGGPHLRLRLLPRTAARAAAVRERARTALGRHLDAHPSAGRMPPADYAAWAERLAAAEGLAEHDRSVREHDAVEEIRYRPEEAVFGGPEAVRAVERHFTLSSDLALGLLADGATGPQRAGFGADALILALAAWEPDRGRLAAALRARPGGAPDPATADRVARGWRQADGPATGSGPKDRWLRSVRELRAELLGLHARGRLRITAPHPTAVPPPGSAAPGQRAVLAVLLRCVHLLHNRLGLDHGVEQRIRRVVESGLTAAPSGAGRADPSTDPARTGYHRD